MQNQSPRNQTDTQGTQSSRTDNQSTIQQTESGGQENQSSNIGLQPESAHEFGGHENLSTVHPRDTSNQPNNTSARTSITDNNNQAGSRTNDSQSTENTHSNLFPRIMRAGRRPGYAPPSSNQASSRSDESQSTENTNSNPFPRIMRVGRRPGYAPPASASNSNSTSSGNTTHTSVQERATISADSGSQSQRTNRPLHGPSSQQAIINDSLLPFNDSNSDMSDEEEPEEVVSNSQSSFPRIMRPGRIPGRAPPASSQSNPGGQSTRPSAAPQAASSMAAGPMHNSLIQIRRGARQDDGSFSFSISVHTSSGRTIMFSQEEIEADDDENEFRILPIDTHSNNDGDNAAQAPSNEVADNSNEDVPGADIEQNVASARLTNSLNIEINNDITHDNFQDDSSDDENDWHGMMEDGMNSDDSDNDMYDDDPALLGSVNINWPSHAGSSGGVNISIQSNDDSSNEPLFRNPPRIRRRERQIRRQRMPLWQRPGRGDNQGASGGSRFNRGTNNSSVNTTGDSSYSPRGRGTDSQPRNNSFMFVLESNSGTRRRRVLNLSYLDTLTEAENTQLKKNIHTNENRLLGYMEECNVGRGFIKEVAFSGDGRLISSPFGFGIRLFSFDPQCNELCDSVPQSPVKLYESTCSLGHVNIVVATQFSPVHNMVVSGCLDGKIAFHQPVL